MRKDNAASFRYSRALKVFAVPDIIVQLCSKTLSFMFVYACLELGALKLSALNDT